MARTVEQELEGLRQRLIQLEEKDGKIGGELRERSADPKPCGVADGVRGASNSLLEQVKDGPSED